MSIDPKSKTELPVGTVYYENGRPAKVYTRCPHCGMTDLRFMNQSHRNAHFRSWQVGGKSKYQCGKCRHEFYTLEFTIPVGMPFETALARVIEAFKNEEVPHGDK